MRQLHSADLRNPGSPVMSAIIAGMAIFIGSGSLLLRADSMLPYLVRGALFCTFPAITWRSWPLFFKTFCIGLAADLWAHIVIDHLGFDGWNSRRAYCDVLLELLTPMRMSFAHPSVANFSNEILFVVNFVVWTNAMFTVWYWLWPVGKWALGYVITMAVSIGLTSIAAVGLWKLSLVSNSSGRSPYDDGGLQLLATVVIATMAALLGIIGWTIDRVNRL